MMPITNPQRASNRPDSIGALRMGDGANPRSHINAKHIANDVQLGGVGEFEPVRGLAPASEPPVNRIPVAVLGGTSRLGVSQRSRYNMPLTIDRLRSGRRPRPRLAAWIGGKPFKTTQKIIEVQAAHKYRLYYCIKSIFVPNAPSVAVAFKATCSAFHRKSEFWRRVAMNNKGPKFPGGIAISALALATPAYGQDAANTIKTAEQGGIADIVVTAQKRAENMQDVPIAVTAVTADALTSLGISSASDIILVTPGLNFTTVAGTAAPRIRGVGTTSALGGNENPVSTYIDGVYIASAASSILSLNNIEQIAVLKGPQGTLFGRNATGGLIQITTRDPQQAFNGKASVSYGNLNTIGGDLYLTGGLGPNLAADIAVHYNNQQDGFGRNLTTGAQAYKSEDLAVRSKWMLGIGDATTAKLALDYAKLNSDSPVRRPVYGSLPVSGVPFTAGPFDTVQNVNSLFRNEQGGVSLNITHEFSGVNLVNITAFRKSKTDLRFDIDGINLPLVDFNGGFKDRQFSEELQLISSGRGPFKWSMGLFYFNALGEYTDSTISNPTSIIQFYSKQGSESFAGYAQGTYDLSASTGLTLGVRYTRETKTFDALGTIAPKAPVPIITPAPAIGRLSVEKPTWRVALDHHLNDDTLIYASYNRGFKSGGFNPATFTPAPEVFKPEILDAFEIGLKTDLLDRHLRINGSTFYYDYKNIQLSSFINGLVKITNATTAKIYGLDLDVTAQPINDLTFTAGLSVIHGRFGYFPNAQISTPLPTGGNVLGQGDATGNRLPSTPDWTIDLGIDYKIPLPVGGLRLAAHYFHSDGWKAEADNRLEQTPYDVVNASILWLIDKDEKLSLRLWGKNLTNQAYASQISTQATADTVTMSPGRTYGVTAGVEF